MRHGARSCFKWPSLVACVNLMRSYVEDFACTRSVKRKREYNCWHIEHKIVSFQRIYVAKQ